MDVTLRFVDLNIAGHLEFEVGSNRDVLTHEVNYKILSVHELLFGIVKIFMKAKGMFSRTYFEEITVFRNIQITDEEGELVIPINKGVDVEQKELKIHYTVKNIEMNEVVKKHNGIVSSFTRHLLSNDNISNVLNTFSLFKNAYSEGVLDFNFKFFLTEHNLRCLNNKNTLKINFKESNNMYVCVVGDGVVQNENFEELEGFLLKDKFNYKIISMSEYYKDKSFYDLGEWKDRKIHGIQIRKEKSSDIKVCNAPNKNHLLDVHNYIRPASTIKTSLDNLMSNEGYILAHKRLISELLKMYNYSVASHGRLEEGENIEQGKEMDSNKIKEEKRKEILEILKINDEMLLSVCLDKNDHPHFIIFYDELMKRLVVSFKGTSTFKEMLYDADCYYTSFYEGFTHRRFKILGEKFLKEKTNVIKKYLAEYNTKELLLVGYSMGAGVASIVSIIIQREKIFQDYKITTFVYAAPPIVSYNLTKVENAFTVNYKNDFIPRLCYGSASELLYRDKSPSGSNKDQSMPIFPKLYHIGKIYHLKRVSDSLESRLIYKEVDLDYFEKLLILRHSLKHHKIKHLQSVFEECLGIIDNSDMKQLVSK